MRPKESTRLESAATTDGTEIIVADDDAEILDESPTYTYLTEPADQGGNRYVRCEDCGAELLTKLGGKDSLIHKRGCSARNE